MGNEVGLLVSIKGLYEFSSYEFKARLIGMFVCFFLVIQSCGRKGLEQVESGWNQIWLVWLNEGEAS